jgi:hypothetical protein
MDKGKIAEWFISLVMERTQAASVVGDLLEIGASQSAAWFWSNVFRTWAANVWRSGKSEPRFVFGIATLGTLIEVGLCYIGSITFALGLNVVINEASLPLSIQYMPALLLARNLVINLGSSFYAGRWIARYARGREVAVCAAMVIIGPVVASGLCALCWCLFSLKESPAPRFVFVWWNWWVILCFAPRLLGAVLVRSRTQNVRAV